jgi:hypothetical protein
LALRFQGLLQQGLIADHDTVRYLPRRWRRLALEMDAGVARCYRYRRLTRDGEGPCFLYRRLVSRESEQGTAVAARANVRHEGCPLRDGEAQISLQRRRKERVGSQGQVQGGQLVVERFEAVVVDECRVKQALQSRPAASQIVNRREHGVAEKHASETVAPEL